MALTCCVWQSGREGEGSPRLLVNSNKGEADSKKVLSSRVPQAS